MSAVSYKAGITVAAQGEWLGLHIQLLLVEDSEQFLIVFLCSDVREVKSVCTQSPVSPQCSFQYQRFVSNVSIFSMKSMSFFFYL